MIHSPPPSGRRSQQGASLLEVLIAVLILAIGLLGIAALQAVTLKNTGNSAERTQAVMQTYTMFDAMRTNRDIARSGGYNRAWACEAPTAADDDDARAIGDIGAWITQLQANMGETACGRIQCGTQSCTVGVRWSDTRGTGAKADNPVQIEIQTTSRL